MEKKFIYLFNKLMGMKRSKESAMFDVALVAMGVKDARLSDAACEIITSKEYMDLDKVDV